MKINNKGFTLVELLAVMVILISISLVAVGTVTSSLTKREDKEREEQEELAIGAAKIYFSLENKSCVTLTDLFGGGYIKDANKIDMLNKTYVIKLEGNEYKFDTSC